MAGYELIDAYLVGLRRRLAWRPDVDDVVAEAGDHLYSAVERLIDDGSSRAAAQRDVLDRFGDSTTVASAFAATSSGGLAIPTTFTRRAGFAALVAAGLWVGVAGLWLASEVLPDESAMIAWRLGWICLLGASASTMVVMIGLRRRHGGLGPLGTVALILAGLGVVATVFGWFVMGWGVLFAVGMLLLALAVHSRDVAPRAAVIAFGGAWSVGVITWSVLRALEVGPRNEWGDYEIVSPVAVAVGVTVLVPGLLGLGRWLSRETPVNLDSAEPLAAA